MLILGIETSCDECASAVVSGGTDILSSVVASQVDVHRRFGGVVPEIASRRHLETIIPVVDEALERADADLEDLDGVAVTSGPGLMGSLLVGINFAKALSYRLGIPLLGVDHVQAHLAAVLLQKRQPSYPFVGLVVSGGHSSLYLVEDLGSYRLLGATCDDAPGEAFDKVARALNLPYPGGVSIENLAASGDREAIPLPRPMIHDPSLDFSFAGLKTAVIYHLRRLGREPNDRERSDIAASFQEAVADVLSAKLLRAAEREGVRQAVVSGGVAANMRLRELVMVRSRAAGLEVFIPPADLCTDNAAMIAAAAHHQLAGGKSSGLELDGYSITRRALK